MTTMFNNEAKLEQFTIWWEAQAETSDRYERANLLLSIMDALAIRVPTAAWQILERGPAALNGEAPSPALWRAFLIAARNNDHPLALSIGFRLLSPNQNGKLSAALVGSVLGSLKRIGFHEEAKSLAIEILITQGL